MKNYAAKNVDEYIAGAAAEGQPILNELRDIVRSTVPGAEESISWGVPFYKYHGLLAGFSILKNHVSFGLVIVLDEKERATLEAKGYATGKKTFQIGFNQAVPVAEIRQLLLKQARMNKSKQKP